MLMHHKVYFFLFYFFIFIYLFIFIFNSFLLLHNLHKSSILKCYATKTKKIASCAEILVWPYIKLYIVFNEWNFEHPAHLWLFAWEVAQMLNMCSPQRLFSMVTACVYGTKCFRISIVSKYCYNNIKFNSTEFNYCKENYCF